MMMTNRTKEILEKTEFGKEYIMAIKDYNITDIRPVEYLLKGYKKAFRKNASQKYRSIKALLDREAIVVETDYFEKPSYTIFTKRTIKAPFGKPLDEYQKIIIE